ncbi:uncharacterized protein ATC70_000176 [Mucor velutinosus]|uniref:4-coumarate--CoA ligase n=1 Tax=Mucor velutinosus TaxID=708070 RepID=A0AAN7DKT1_9FUNG|nr:hypothetical protein ATC70_000176 [Mucor velutinosus]
MVYTSKLPAIEEPTTGIIQFIFANVNKTPEDKPLLIDALNDRFITYAQLKSSVLKFAAGLQDVCGFNSTDVLALYAPNQYNYSIPLLGAVAANGATTTANPNYNIEELSYQLEMTKAKVLICHEENLETALQAAERVGILKKNIFVFGDKAVKGIQPFQTALIRERKAVPAELTHQEAKDKVAYLCFSSGTTGKSKGVMTTHANITANTCQYTALDNAFIDPNVDRMIGVLPLFHIFGLTAILHTALYWGIPVYILPRFDLVKFCETVQERKITFACLVPPIYLLLAKHEIIPKYDLSSLRIGISGAAPLSADLGREVKARLPNLTIKQGYGLTETSPSAIVEPTDRTIDGSTGILLPNMLAKVVDENGNEVPQGERGELWLKGPNIMKGYINNPEATADCIDKEGYFHTGDVVVVDKDQHFYVVDRIKELIKYKGFQVPPAELEGILLTSPIIADCAVIGVYDAAQASEIPRAYVTLKPHVVASDRVAEDIMKFVADQVVPYKQIRAVRFIDVIPKSPAGKILRRLLRDAAMEEEKNATHKPRL